MVMELQGHISFPLILDVFPFTTAKLGIKIQEADVHTLPIKQQTVRSKPPPKHYIHQAERTLKLNDINGAGREQINSDNQIDDGFVSSAIVQPLPGDAMFLCNRGSSESIGRHTYVQSTSKVGSSSVSLMNAWCNEP